MGLVWKTHKVYAPTAATWMAQATTNVNKMKHLDLQFIVNLENQ